MRKLLVQCSYPYMVFYIDVFEGTYLVSFIGSFGGTRDDLDDYDECSNKWSDDKSKDGTLSRKILHAFKRQ